MSVSGAASRRAFRRAPRRRRPPLLTLPQRLAAFLLLVVPAVVLGVRFFNDTEDRLNAVLRQAAPLAEAELTRALGREVRIGALTPDLSVRTLLRDFFRRASLGVIPVTATDVAVAAGATFGSSPTLASARRAVAFVSIPKLIAGRTNEAVERVLLEEPYLLLVRDRTGRLNLQDLIKPRKGPPGKPFVTRVDVEQGTLRFVDFASKVRGGQTNDLDRIDAAADVGARSIRFTASARGKPGTATARRLGGPVSAEGTVGRGTPGQGEFAPGAGTARYLANVRARDADAAYWLSYFVGEQPTLGQRAARADARVTLLAPRASARAARSPSVGCSPTK
ncbi:MAG TPA: hypothetical protein VM490_05880 [Armatimonadaceae bacterium]|nr:hypothetical protein [Armatimonadaceae bacterium]